jgi:predicted nucleic acid-binding protein
MILADTTIWIDHFRSDNQEMRSQLGKSNIVIHPFIIAELALGLLQERSKTLAWLDRIPQVGMAHISEVRQMIEMRSLCNRGIGLVDAHLIASIFLYPSTLLWTKDKRLRGIAEELGIAAVLP